MAGFGKIAKNVGEFFQPGDWQQALAKRGTILDSNKPINKLPDGGVKFNAGGMMSGIPRSISNVRHGGMGIMDGIKEAHKNADGSWNYGAIAGSYLGVSAGYRVVSGGGLHRDANGNPDIIGIPFV